MLGGQDTQNAFVSRSAAHVQIQRLQASVRKWFKGFKQDVIADIASDVRLAKKQSRIHRQESQHWQKQPFEYLLQSYKAWEQYNDPRIPDKPTQIDLAEETYFAASSALQLGLEPSLLRIFAHEQMASIEQAKCVAGKRTGVFGWQAHNRRALVAISEAIRVVLGEFTSERPSSVAAKLLLGAAALSWDLSHELERH